MLPLVSNTSPTATGSSSIEKLVIACSTLSSNTRKFSFSKPETGRLKVSFTATGTRTSVRSTRRSDRGKSSCAAGAVFERDGIDTWAQKTSGAHNPSPAESATVGRSLMRFSLLRNGHHVVGDGLQVLLVKLVRRHFRVRR